VDTKSDFPKQRPYRAAWGHLLHQYKLSQLSNYLHVQSHTGLMTELSLAPLPNLTCFAWTVSHLRTFFLGSAAFMITHLPPEINLTGQFIPQIVLFVPCLREFFDAN
jgi:hypothetical protein